MENEGYIDDEYWYEEFKKNILKNFKEEELSQMEYEMLCEEELNITNDN